MNIPAFLKQPSTIKGTGYIIGVIAAAVAGILTHDTSIIVGVGVMAAGIVHVIMPDNSGAQSSVEKLVTDAATAVAQKRLAAAMPQLLADTMAAVSAFQTPAPTTTTTTTTVATPASVA